MLDYLDDTVSFFVSTILVPFAMLNIIFFLDARRQIVRIAANMLASFQDPEKLRHEVDELRYMGSRLLDYGHKDAGQIVGSVVQKLDRLLDDHKAAGIIGADGTGPLCNGGPSKCFEPTKVPPPAISKCLRSDLECELPHLRADLRNVFWPYHLLSQFFSCGHGCHCTSKALSTVLCFVLITTGAVSVSGAEVIAWGDNQSGQTTIPAGLSGVVAIEAGYTHTVALKIDGTVAAWGGSNWAGQTTVPAGLSGVTQVVAGAHNSVALKSDGTVVNWGYTSAGRLVVPAGLTGVQAIDSGEEHTLALKNDGTLAAWGNTAWGQNTVPPGLSGVKAIAAGSVFNVALKTNDTLVIWGYNGHNQQTVPAGLSGIKAIAAGIYHIVALKNDGTVVVWGNNDHGQKNVPLGLNGVKAVAAGGYHTIALKNDGTVVVWGNNQYGQSNVPLGLSGVKAVAAGEFYTVALLDSGPRPQISAHPQPSTVACSLPASFSVTASGVGTLSYQWRKGSVNIPNANSTTYAITAVSANNEGNYDVIVTDSNGSTTSNAATLNVISPAIFTAPVNRTVYASQSATFTVVAAGTGTLSYQWRKNGENLINKTDSTLLLTTVNANDAGSYDVIVTDNADSATSDAAVLAVISPAIFTQPTSRSGYAGQSTTFNVIAAGTGTVTYQWRKNGVNIPTATSSSLTLSPLNYRSAAEYDVVVTDDFDSATSDPAELTVLSPAPNVSISPGDTTVALGGNLTFTATVDTGIPPFTYQWRKNSVLIAKATNPTLVLTNIQRTQEGIYDVVVKNASGVDVSNTARLSLPPLVAVTANPTDTAVNPGQTAAFTVDVPGATAWQWLKNGVAIKNATTSTLTILNADASSAGLYSVTVTTPAGKVTTSAAQLRVNDSGLLIYKLTGTGTAYEGTVSTVAALSGYMVLDRAGQRGGLILGSKRGSQSIHSLEVHENLHTQSTGPVPKTQTVVSEMVADEFVLWVNGADSLLTIQKTLSRTDLAVGPATLKGYANSIDIGPKVRIETVSLTLVLDAVNSLPARQNAETVEQAMSRISQDMQLKGSALVE